MRIRAATLNTWALPEPLALDTPERMAAIGDRIAELDLDVVAFQEVWTKKARKQLVKAGRRAGLAFYHNRATLGDSGLVTLSRFPIESAHFEPFQLRGDPGHIDNGEFWSGKGLSRVRLRTEAGPVTLINTHLHARYPSVVSHEYEAHRIGQVVQVALNAHDCRDPLLVLGDFNFGEHHPEYTILTGLTSLRDAAAELDRRQATVFNANPYRASHKPDKRIDFTFFRSGASLGVVPLDSQRSFDETVAMGDRGKREGSYSNHAGVVSEFEIRERSLAESLGPPPGALVSPDALILASELLSQGRSRAQQRRESERNVAGVGLGAAVLAAAALRNERVARRRFLRTGLQLGALAALTPGIGFSLLSEVYVPDEIRAFEHVASQLDHFRPAPRPTHDDELQLS